MGLDLGQRRDYTALAVVEKLERARPYGQPEFEALLVRHAERMPLGTRYPAVLERVREFMRLPELRGLCELVVDAIGVGAPIVDMLRTERQGSALSAVTITAGERESARPGPGCVEFNVPKKDLVGSLQLAIEKGEIRIGKGAPWTAALTEELMDMRKTTRENGRERMGAEGAGQHNDLVMTLALACWSICASFRKTRSACSAGN
jgi:hypothetical protein